MKSMGGTTVHDMIMKKQKFLEGKIAHHLDEETDISRKKVSKLIIKPNNYWNLQWNNLI